MLELEEKERVSILLKPIFGKAQANVTELYVTPLLAVSS